MPYRATWSLELMSIARRNASANSSNSGPVPGRDLRHTFASHLIRSGADVYTVSRQLGHSRASITLDLDAGEFDEAQNVEALRERLTIAFGD